MDFSDPGIGLGKAGNNPYQWAALGAHGLQSMLASTPTNDPESMGSGGFLGDWGGGQQTPQFARAAAVAGQPVSTIQRQVHGLLPVLAMKLGLLPQTVGASEDQLNIERLGLEQIQRQKMSDMMDQLGILTNAARISPQLASLYYRQMPQIPNVTPESIAQIKTVPEETLEARNLNAQLSRDLAQQRVDIAQQGRDIAEQRLRDQENKPDKTVQTANRKRYSDMLGYLGKQMQASFGDPNISKAYEALLASENADIDPDQAWQQVQPILHPAQAAGSGGGDVLGGLKNMIGGLFGGGGASPTSAGGAARPPTMAPKVVRPW